MRMKALQALQPYVEQDQRVRDAVLEALMHDENAQVRTAAIGMLDAGAVGLERAAGAADGFDAG